MKLERVNVLGVGVSVLNLPLATRLVLEAVRQKTRGYICVTGVHGVVEAQSNPDFRRILNHSFLCTPDGVPMVWMGKYHGHKQMGRVYGPDLMIEICAASPALGLRHFLYGGANGVVHELKQKLELRFPGLQIVGTYEPPFRPLTTEEKETLCAQVKSAQPDIFWVGLSTPKQELFMAQNLDGIAATIMIGVGAAFDFHAGRVRQAPLFMQRNGLEWAYRVYREPRRLWRRYLKNNPLFLWKVAGQLSGLKKYVLD
jgi:N-acetylglucosaminyldiphosphoundecaprenol N-acetyl-beta-D-mannosaminyltransferase